MKTTRPAASRPSGAASLLVTMIIGLLLIAVIATLSVISNRESRTASDVDLSTKALTVAQSGVEKAAAQISANPNYTQPACNSASGSATPQNETQVGAASDNTAITCSIVTNQTNNLQTKLDRDKTLQLNLAGNTIGAMTLQWNDKTADSSTATPASFSSTCLVPGHNPNYDPNQPNFNQGYQNCSSDMNGWPYPAMLELNFIWWNKAAGNSFAPNDLTADSTANSLCSSRVLVGPYEVASGLTEVAYSTPACGANTPSQTSSYWNSGNPFPTSGVVTGCSTSLPSTYRCAIAKIDPSSFALTPLDLANIIPSPTTKNIILRVTPRYAGTYLSFQFYASTASTSPVTFTAPLSTIDVTARVNDLYRRVVVQKPNTHQVTDFLDTALYSGDKICKNMVVDINHNALTGDDGKNHC